MENSSMSTQRAESSSKIDASPSSECITCEYYIYETSQCKILPSYKNYVSSDFSCDDYKPSITSKLKKNSFYGKQAAESRRYVHGDIECIDAIKAALSPEEWRGFVKGNVLKYVWREAYKGGDCDLRKAADYLGRYFEKGGEVETVAEK